MPSLPEDPVPHRTTLLLDETRTPARELGLRDDCSTSEAAARAKRIHTLERLFELFEGHDADSEIRRLKEEDGGF